MTLQEKAKQYLEYAEQGDPRCDILLFNLCNWFNYTPTAMHNIIKDLANDNGSS